MWTSPCPKGYSLRNDKTSPGRIALLFERLEYFPHRVEDALDLRFLDDQRRREGEGIAGIADEDARLEALHQPVVAAAAGGSRLRRQLDRAHQAEVADVDDVALALQRVDRVFPVLLKRCGALEQPLFLVSVERADAGGAGERMT